MALELIKISEFPQVNEPSEWIAVADANGIAYKISKADFKAWLGTVQTIVPKAISPTDPAPTLPGIYRPTASGTYANLGGLVIDNDGKLNEVLYDGSTFVNVVTPLPPAINKIPDWVPGTYITGEQTNNNGQIWSVKEGVISTTQEPGTGNDWEKKLNVPETDNIVGKNLFNREAIRENYAISTEGVIFPQTGFWISEFIPVTELTDYIWSATNIPNSLAMGFYSDPNDLESSIVGVVQIPDTVTKRVLPFTTPAGANYVAFTVKHSSWSEIPSDMMLRLANTGDSYEPFSVFKNISDMSISRLLNAENFGEVDKPKSVTTKEYVDNELSKKITPSTELVKLGKNLFNRDDIRENYAISVEGLIFPQTGFWISNFIPVDELTDYIWSATNIPNSLGMGFYSEPNDLESSITGGLQIPNTVTKRVLPFTTPAGTKYVAFTVKHSAWAEIPADMMLRLANTGDSYEPYEIGINIKDWSISKLYNAKSYGEVNDPKSVVTKEYFESHSGGQTAPVDVIEMGDLGNVSIQVPSSEINILTSYGQSNSAGQQTAPALSVNNFRGNLMLGSQEWGAHYGNVTMNVLNPLYARPAVYTGLTQEQSEELEITNQAHCESQNINFANANKNMLDRKYLNGVDSVFLALTASAGGRSIELLSKGAPNTQATFYALMIGHLTAAKDAAITAEKSVSCNSFTWIQGEYNATQQAGQGWTDGTPATNNKEQYKVYLKQLITDIFADVKAIFAQNDNPAFFMTQHATGWINSFEMPVQMALLETANEDSRAIMVCPLYQVTDRGHLDPNGQRWIGEYISKAYNQVVLNGKPWRPLQPTKLTRSGKRLVIDYFVPVAPLRFNTHTVRQMANYGFTIKVNGAVSPIEKVEITSASQITITALSDIDTGVLEVGYASLGALYGNVCDSDNYRAFEVYKELPTQLKPEHEPKDENGVVIYNKPYPLQNFSLQFYYKIESGDKVKAISHVLD